jgi:F0F1-type ATP synthase beta subunit
LWSSTTLGDNARVVSMNPTEGLMRGMEVVDTGNCARKQH